MAINNVRTSKSIIGCLLTNKERKKAFMNIRGQTGLNISKQIQIENFIKSYKVDILNCQEINISDETFSTCNFISSQYDIISNNAENK